MVQEHGQTARGEVKRVYNKESTVYLLLPFPLLSLAASSKPSHYVSLFFSITRPSVTRNSCYLKIVNRDRVHKPYPYNLIGVSSRIDNALRRPLFGKLPRKKSFLLKFLKGFRILIKYLLINSPEYERLYHLSVIFIRFIER